MGAILSSSLNNDTESGCHHIFLLAYVCEWGFSTSYFYHCRMSATKTPDWWRILIYTSTVGKGNKACWHILQLTRSIIQTIITYFWNRLMCTGIYWIYYCYISLNIGLYFIRLLMENFGMNSIWKHWTQMWFIFPYWNVKLEGTHVYIIYTYI